MRIAIVLIVIVLAALTAMRDISIGTDTENYVSSYERIQAGREGGVREVEPIFQAVSEVISKTGMPYQGYFFIIALIIAVGSVGFFRQEIGWLGSGLLLCIWLLYPFYYSLSLNVIRQGVAFFIYFGVFVLPWKKRSVWWNTLLMLLPFIHVSATIFCITHIISKKLTLRIAAIFWCFAALVAGTNLIEHLFAFVLPAFSGLEYYMTYSEVDVGYHTGFRYDFFLFSLVCILAYGISLRVHEKRADMEWTEWSNWLLVLFFINNGVGMIFSFLSYYDRFMIWSWALVPAMVYAIFLRWRATFYTKLVLVSFLMMFAMTNFAFNIFYFGQLL